MASAMRGSSFEICGLIARKQRKEFGIVAATVGLGLRHLAFLHQQPQYRPQNQSDQNSSREIFRDRHDCPPSIPRRLNRARHCADSSTSAGQFLRTGVKLFGPPVLLI